ncbi:MAG: DNA polymerase III subunit gamma/tau [Bacteroides sp.]|nr:DNA polymerase III subunit gamma/tau [Bacteroides sp.]
MENYIVSARKYRPSTFDSVVGQQSLTTTLKNAIATQKLAHAYLFCGPRGVGKTTCARIFAKTINCMSPTPEGEACDGCESCVAFNQQRSYNIHELDAASNNSVDDIRQLVDQVRIPPQIGKYKVYIIDEVHMLSASAFNAFLKTLEEPPRHAIFILATTEKHKILPTILSRCQIYDFNRMGVSDTVDHLMYVANKEGITAEPEALNVIALKADGGMRDALSIFDQVVSFTGGHITYQSVIENLNVLDYEYYFRLTDFVLGNRVSDALLLFNDVLNHGFEGGHFISGLASHFRDILVSKDEATLALLEVGASIRDRYRQQAIQCPLPFLYKALKLCNDCDLQYRTSKNKRLLIELTLIQLAQLITDEEAPGSGRGPAQEIKPVFRTATQETTSTSSTTTAGGSSGSSVPSGAATAPAQPSVRSQSPAPVSPATPSQPAASVSPVVQPTVATSAAGNAAAPSSRREEGVPRMPEALRSVQHSPEKKIPVMKKSSLGLSIRNPNRESEEKKATVQQQHAEVPQEDFIFTERDLNYYWREYAGQLPKEHKATSIRMQNIRPVLVSETTFEVVVDNNIIERDFIALVPAVQDFLRARLRNSKIAMKVRVSAPKENVKAFSRVEKFQMMSQKNNALLLLKEEFGLELS